MRNRRFRTPAIGIVLACAATLVPVSPQPVWAQETADGQAARQYAVALGFQKKKLYAQAARRWGEFIKAYPQHERIANAHYHLGVCLFRDKKLTEAAATFRTVLEKFPKFEHLDGAQFNLALVLYNVASESNKPEDFKQAAQQFTLVPQRNAKSEYAADALYYQAECLYHAGEQQAALPVYQKLIAEHADSPLLPDAFYALGTAQQELNQFAEATQTYQAFLQKFAEHAQAAEVRLRLGIVLFEQQKFAEAEQLFAQTAQIKEFAFADFAVLRRAQCLYEQDKVAEAAVVYESLPKTFKESQYIGAALLAAGKCRYRLEQFNEAANDLKTIVDGQIAEAPEAAYWLGRTLIQQKKPADAAQVLEQAMAAFPQSEFLPELTLARIDALADQDNRRGETVALYAGFATKFAEHEFAPEALYRAALTALQLEQHAPARQHADAFLANQKFAKHQLAPEVLFIGAEANLLAPEPDLSKAEALYRRLVQEHADHKHVPQAKLRIGFCLYSAKKYDETVAFLSPVTGQLKEPAQVAETRLLIGRAHADAGRHKQAVPELRAARDAHPKWDRGDEVLFSLALSLRAENDLKTAAGELQRLTQQFGESSLRDQAYYQLGDIALVEKQYDPAVAHYREVVAKFPMSELVPAAQFGIGATLYQKGDDQQAVAELSKLIQAHPNAEVTPDGRYLRGLSYQRLAQFGPAAEDLTAFLNSKPDEADALDAHFALGLCQVGLKQHPQAIATFSALLKSKPDYAAADRVHYELGFALLETKQEQQAATAFRELATKHPKSPLAGESWFRVGEFHENGEQPAEAAKAFAAGLAVAAQPELKERLLYKLGWLQYTQSNYAEAAGSFQALVKEHPQGELAGDATYLAGECLFRQNQFDRALPLFAKVIDAKQPKYHARALYRAGTCTGNLKQWAASQQHYQALAAQFPKFEQIHEARYGLGWALQNQNKLAEAKQVYDQITKETNTETAAKSRFMIGECAFAEKKYDEAVEHFLETALGYPYKEWQALGYFEAGRCFIELKNTAQARETLETVVKKFPEHPRAKDAQTLLGGLKD